MNNEFKIEKCIPIPERSRGLTAALRGMEIGDSFLWSGRSIPGSTLALLKPMKFATRAVEAGRYRIWRTA